MTDTTNRVFIDIGDVAKIAGVGRSAVGNWRKRHPDFPHANANGSFDLVEVERWLIENGKISGPASRQFILWRLADALGVLIGTDEMARFVVASLVYLEACARSAETGERPVSAVIVDDEHRWVSIRRSDDADLGARLVEAGTAIEQANPLLDGLLVRGLSTALRVDVRMLRTLLDTIEEAARDAMSPRVSLFEDAVARFQETDRFRGEFATPPDVTHLMVRLGACRSGTVFDPAAGEGGLLLMAAVGDERDDEAQMDLVGYEINRNVVQVSRSRFFLYGFDVDMRVGDVFRVSPDDLPNADLVLLDPPLAQSEWGDADVYLDDRWSFGVPPPKSADFAWIQLAVQSLRESGRAVVVTTPGATFRGGREAAIRAALLDAGVIEAVILLPARLRTETSIPLVVWVLRPPTTPARDAVLLVDASYLGERGRSQHSLDETDIDRIVSTVDSWRSDQTLKELMPDGALVVPVAELEDANLDPARHRPIARVDVDQLRSRVAELRSDLERSRNDSEVAVNAVLAHLRHEVRQGRDETGPSGTRCRISEVAEVMRGAVPAKPTDDGSGVLFFGIAEITAGGASTQRFVDGELDEGAARLKTGDVALALMSNIGRSALIAPRYEGAVLGRECAALRPSGDAVTGAWLYVWTRSTDFRRQADQHVSGSTMPRLNARALPEFTLPIPDLARQIEVQRMLEEYEQAVSPTGRLLEQLNELRDIEVELLGAEIEDD